MKSFLLDTCTISDFFRGTGRTVERIRATPPQQIVISTITRMEILYGFALNPRAKKKYSNVFQDLNSVIQIVPFNLAAADAAAEIRASLKLKGTPVGSWDLLIGACAVANDCILVTSNVNEFERIESLQIENWR